MIEYIAESRRVLPFIGYKSGSSEWLEDLSRAMSPLKSIIDLEGVTYLFGDSQIYGLIYPVQSLISDRFFEEIYRKKEDSKPDKIRLKKQNDTVKTDESSEITAIDLLSAKKKSKAGLENSVGCDAERKTDPGHGLKDGPSRTFRFREKNDTVKTDESSELNAIDLLLTKGTRIADLEKSVRRDAERKTDPGRGLKDGFLQTGQKIDLTEVEKKLPMELRTREELLRNIINRYGEEIKDIHPGQGLNTLKQVLKSPGSTSIEKLKRTKQDSFGIAEEHYFGKNFKNVISERLREKFSRHIEGISAPKKLLEEKSGKVTELNQQTATSLNDYHVHNIKSLDSNKQLIKDKEFSVTSERISEQFSRRIQGISASKKILGEKSGNTNSQDRHSSIYQFDSIPIPDLKISETKRKLNIISQTDSNELLKQIYSNNENKTKIKEDTTEIFQNLIEKIGQVINQNNRDTAPSKQNIFNIHVSGDIPTSEKDLQNLSDRLVLILKEQARRHGIDLS